MISTDRFEKVEIASRADLRSWLSSNHTRAEGVWIVRFMKNAPEKFVDRLVLLDELLCFGWVDGIARKLDDQRTMQLVFPRQQQAWSASYKERAERLEAEGLMAEPGRGAIERSKQVGRWDDYVEVDRLAVPDDLRAALRRYPVAEAFFDGSAPSYRRNVLRWIFAAKRIHTRVKRIELVVDRSGLAEKLPQM